jgi:hypothetical protein
MDGGRLRLELLTLLSRYHGLPQSLKTSKSFGRIVTSSFDCRFVRNLSASKGLRNSPLEVSWEYEKGKGREKRLKQESLGNGG